MPGEERRARAPGSTHHPQHTQDDDDDIDGVKYCPNMASIVLPSYVPSSDKAGYSGGIDQAEQIQVQLNRQQYSVCTSCKDGPRCADIYSYKPVLEVEVGSPCANTTRTAHTAIQISVSSVPLYSKNNPDLAHTDGGECSRDIIREEFNTNVSGLIEKWEETGGGGSKLEVEEGGSNFARRKSSEFQARQAIFEKCQEARDPNLSLSNIPKYSPSYQNANIERRNNFIESDSFISYISHTEVRGQSPLAETRANRKRGREWESYSCGTKKRRPNTR